MPEAAVRAAIDIGTNSVRLLVADFSTRPPRARATGLTITRLGEGLDASGRIKPEALKRTARAVAGFASDARRFGGSLVVYATAAMREASNGAEARAAIEEAAGAPVLTLSGEQEASVAYRGVALGHALSPDSMVLDIGGGSTEFSTEKEGRVEARSLALGSVRQTERHLRHDPPLDAECAVLEADVRALVTQGLAGRRAGSLYGVAGSVTQLVALELELDPYDSARVDGFDLTLATIEKWRKLFARSTVAEKRRLKGMVPERAETVLSGTIILQETLRQLNLSAATVSEYDGLWGALSIAD